MLYYPQLVQGSMSQYPIARNNIRRTVINLLADGSRIAMTDAGASAVAWALSYTHLTSGEVLSIQTLFESASGRWQSFTYLDPTDNLLDWSEDLTQAVWKADALLAISAGSQDPLGRTGASHLLNNAQIVQSVVQTLDVPGNYRYCLSLYARADQTSSFNVIAGQGQTPFSAVASVGWSRFIFSFQFSGASETLKLGVQVPAGASIYIFGMQLEAQLGAGSYKKTRDHGGVYPATRFNQDILSTVATAVNQYSMTVKLVSNVAG